jgi:hypothetical protein
MVNQFDKQMRDKMDRQARVTQECVNSWSGSDLYDCFREITNCIHSIENREGFTQIGWKQLQRMEHELVKIFATKKNADLPI